MRVDEPLYITLNNYPDSCNLCRTGVLADYVDAHKWQVVDHFALGFVRSGSMRFYYGDEIRKDFKRGDMYIHLPWLKSRLEFLEPDTQVSIVEFTKEFLDYNPLGETIKDRFLAFLMMDMNMRKLESISFKIEMSAEDQNFLIKQFNRLLYEFERRREGMFEVMRDILIVIVDIIGWKYLYQPSIINVEKKYRRLNNLLVSSVEYIHEHFQEKILLDDLVKMFGTSKTVYCTLFKQIYGVTFHTYLNELRRENAVHLLMETELSADEIAILSGYGDFSALYRSFMKYYGVSPGQYRRNREKC